MKRIVWTGLVLAVCVAGSAQTASATSIDQPSRRLRVERMERLHEQLALRRAQREGQVRERSLQRREARRERFAASREQRLRQRERVREQRLDRAARERASRITRPERFRLRHELRRGFRGIWR
jgi:hypothetical protein